MIPKKYDNIKDKKSDMRFHRKWKIAVIILSCIVFFCTITPLIMPVITMSAQETYCGYEEHIHTEECMSSEGELICGYEEHTHLLECYADTYADIEDEDVWGTTVPLLSGDRNADVVAVAESQIGYRESDRNYLVFDENDTPGYTRYGHWYGDAIDQSGERLENGLSIYAYTDWDAMFVSFVLDRAGIYDMGFDWDAGNWADFLAGYGIYTDATDYIPEPGDLVFFTPYSDGRFYVGIVTDVNCGFLDLFGETVNSVTVVYGDADNEVTQAVIDVGAIYGYGVLTQRAEEIEPEEPDTEVPADDSSVSDAVYDEEMAYPENEETVEEIEEPEAEAEESDVTASEEIEEPEAEDSKEDAGRLQETASEETIEAAEDTKADADESEAVVSEEDTEAKADESEAAVPEEKSGKAEDTKADVDESEAATSEEGTKAKADESEATVSEEDTKEKPSESVNKDEAETKKDAVSESSSDTDTLIASGNDYSVTMTYGADARIPDGAKLYVREIMPFTAEYDSYIAGAKDALGIGEEADVDLKGRFFDIKIMTKKGEYKPNAPVRVDITYDKQIVDVPTNKVSAVHFAEEGPEQVDTLTGGTVKGIDTVAFEAESFSVYGVVYTVDFTYYGYTYSVYGNEEITLTELMNVLGIAVAPDDVAEVRVVLKTQNDEEVDEGELYAFVKDGEWVIKSDTAFGNTYNLIIETCDSKKYVVEVTDEVYENLASFITDAVLEIDGKKYGQGETWVVRPEADYNLTLTFRERGAMQFPKGGDEMVMDLPEGLTVKSGSGGSFDIPAGLAGTVTGNTWWIDDAGKLHIKFGDDPEDILTRASNAFVTIDLSAEFDGIHESFEFREGVTRNVVYDTSSDVSISKKGTYNRETGKMDYTITVKSAGKNENVKVTDTLGNTNLLTIDPDSIVISSSTGENVELVSGTDPDTGAPYESTTDDGFIRTIKNMVHNETVTISYSANVDHTKLGPGGVVEGEDGKNTVKVKPDDVPEKETTDVLHKIQFSDISKVNTTSTDNGETVTLNWKLEANTGMLSSLVGSNIIDTIDYSSKDVMKYVAPDGKVPLHVVGTDADGNEHMSDVEATLYDSDGQQYWIWEVENIGETPGTPLRYEITYSTVATKQNGSVTVKNNTSNESGGNDSGTGVVPGTSTQEIVADKKATKVTEEYIDWTIVINVPEVGFPSGLTVFDELPHANGGISPVSGLRDTLVGEPVVDGLVNDESWGYSINNEPLPYYQNADGTQKFRQSVTIDFYHDLNKTEKGLDDEPRTITIKLRTKNDPDWMAYSNTLGSGDPAFKHWNIAKVNGYEIKDYGIPLSKSIKKQVIDGLNPPADSDGDGLREYTYAVTLANVTDVPIVIEDTFDKDVFSFVGPGSHWSGWHLIAAAEQEYQLNRGVEGYAASFDSSNEGSVVITADSLPMKPDGSYYEYYRIYYVLEYKDESVESLLEQQALANGGTFKIGNTAVWEDIPGHCDVEYKVPVLDKVGAFLNSNNEREYTFYIDVNPGMRTLNNGTPMELTDTHTENLSVDYTSIVVYKIPEGVTIPMETASQIQQYLNSDWIIPKGEVTWNFSGRDGVFTVPDSTHYIIKYNALVLGAGEQDFANEAEMNGFSSLKEDSRTFEGGATAGATICQLKLLKHKDGMTSHGLQGAVFQLFRGTGIYDDQTGEEIKEPMKWGKSWSNESGSGNVGENITFTTDDNGYCMIALNQTDHGAELDLGVHYFLKEVESPAGYKIDSSVEYWEFTLTDVPAEVNYGDPDRPDEDGRRQWVYFYYNDVMKMANKPTEDPIEVSVDKYWFDEYGEEISEENLDPDLVATIQLLRKKDNGDYVPVKVEYSEESEGTDAQPIITELSEDDTSGQVELNMENSWAYSWKNLPRTVHTDDDTTIRYTYKIEEVKVDGYIVSLTENETEVKKTYALKNYDIPEDEDTSVTVEKDWQDYSGFSIDGTSENLPPSIQFYLYQVTSTTPFETDPTSGGSKYYIAEDSRLVYPGQTTDDGEISEEGGHYALYQITKGDSWQTTFEDLPKVRTADGKTYYYAYYTKELPVEGYNTTYTQNGETRTIVNRKSSPDGEYIDVGLTKKWLTGDDETPPAGASATFTLHQLKSDQATSDGTYTETSVTQTVKLPSKGSWSTTIKNLIRKDTEGYYYKYYITEDSCSPAGYTFTYTDDLGKDADHAITEDGKTVEVTNRDELTEANVTKLWKDQNSDNKEWDPNVDTITLHLTRMRGNEQDATFGNAGVVDVIAASDEVRSITPTLEGVAGTVTLKTPGKPSDGYVVKLQGLEKYYDSEHEYTYLFSEETVASYHDPVYTEVSGTNSVDGNVVSGGSIINTPEGAYSLPESGGIGTTIFYLLGAGLVISAFMLLFKVKAAR